MSKSVETRLPHVKINSLQDEDISVGLAQVSLENEEAGKTTPVEPYGYSPIDGAAGEIRLLELLPGHFSDAIRIKIRTISLLNAPSEDTASSSRYEAVSYVWGSTKNLVKITLVDEGTDYLLGITQNLAGALPYLRDEKKSRTLWIDAICINQTDLAERSEQVMRMDTIFSWADRVVVWLGPPKASTSIAIEVLGDLGRRLTIDSLTFTLNWNDPILESSPYMNTRDMIYPNKDIPYNDSTQDALISLLASEWFERLWVWQEVHLAETKTVLYCGHDHIPWSQFQNALLALWSITTEYSDHFQSLIYSRQAFCTPALNSSYNSIFRTTRFLNCTDPLDRVYALQGVLLKNDSDYIVLKPDYSAGSEAKIGANFVLNYIFSQSSLGILELCNPKDRGNLPTWIPNFFGDEVYRDRELRMGFASVGSIPEVKHNQYKLTVKAFKHKTLVTAVQKSNIRYDSSAKEVWQEIRDLWKLLPKQEDPLSIKRQLNYLCHVLVSGQFRDVYERQSSILVSSSEGESGLLEVLNENTPKEFSDTTMKFLARTRSYLHDRCLFTTTDNHFGLGPEGTEIGDSIYILMGANFPFILRPFEGRAEYQVVGPCYLSGFMHGEAFLGPLPANMKYYEKATKDGFFMPAFLDSSTGQVQYEDPRLSPLKGWRKVSFGNEDWRIKYVNEDTGEEHYMWHDPRLTSIALKERGIEIEDIVLI